MRTATTNLLLLLLVAALTVFPLIYLAGARFEGADALAEEVVAQVAPGYTPWFRSLWEPPGAEVESLLFALQAAVGAGAIGYYLGYNRGRKADQSARRRGSPC